MINDVLELPDNGQQQPHAVEMKPVAMGYMVDQNGQPIVNQLGQPVLVQVPLAPKSTDLPTHLADVNDLFIKQKLKWNQRSCCCYDLDNVYDAYVGDKKTYDSHIVSVERKVCCCDMSVKEYKGPEPIIRAREKTGFWTRAFCRPHHSFMMEVTYPTQGAGDNVQYTIVRPGRTACCGGFVGLLCNAMCGAESTAAKPCVGFGACMTCCADEMTVHRGALKAGPNLMDEPSIPKEGKPDPVYIARQPPGCQVMFEPGVDVFKPEDQNNPIVSIRGPMCFGGLSEYCCDNHFHAYNGVKDAQSQPIGEVKKIRPQTCWEMCVACSTKIDYYGLDMKGANSDQKAAMYVSALMTDYMFFERDDGAIYYDANNKVIYINFCYCYLMGCLIPCTVCIPIPQQ